jgi:hypothetical protein
MLVPPPISRREQEGVSFLSAATPSLGSGGKSQLGRGIRSSYPGLLPVASRPGLDAGTSRYEEFSYPANTSDIQGIRSSASTMLKMAVRSRIASQRGVGRRWRTPLAMVQGVFHLLQAVAQEPQEPEHVLMPYEHRNAA